MKIILAASAFLIIGSVAYAQTPADAAGNRVRSYCFFYSPDSGQAQTRQAQAHHDPNMTCASGNMNEDRCRGPSLRSAADAFKADVATAMAAGDKEAEVRAVRNIETLLLACRNPSMR